MKCPTCSFESPDGFKFCGQCGNSFDAVAPPTQGQDQRRTVTILFADVSGFTAMSERLDPETVRDIMDGCFKALTDEIQQFGGTIDKFIGDAVMALFGAPVAHGDDPERAIRAGLGMQNAIQRYSAGLEQERGLKLGIRIGINTGRVVWGRVGGSAGGTFTVMGDAVNVASRLEEAAPVGGIYVGEPTFRETRRQFQFEALDPIPLKGKAEPVRVFRVLGEAIQQTVRQTMGVGPRTPFVGRDEELLRVREMLLSVRESPRVQSLTLRAPAGGGKSRLIAELRALADEEGQRVLMARASAFGEGSVWAPWAALLVRAAGLTRGRSRGHQRSELTGWLDRVLPTPNVETRENWQPILELVAGIEDEESQLLAHMRGSPQRLQAAIHEAWPVFFSLVASDKTTIVIAEDLQWWPNASLELLASLVEVEARLVVVGTTRPELDSSHWPPDGDRHSTRDLEPLSAKEIIQLTAGILGDEDAVTPWLALRITDQSGGNPFFAEEIVQSLIDQNVLLATDDGWHVDESALGSESVPKSVEGVVQARLDRLRRDEQRVLQKASAAGRVFWDKLLVDGMEEPDAVNLLARLTVRDFVYPRKRSRFSDTREYAFKHALIRDVAYENTLRKHRRLNHQQIAEWIVAESSPNEEAYSEVLATQYLDAGLEDKALPFLVSAGERALMSNATRVARGNLERSVELLEKYPDDALIMRSRKARGALNRLDGEIDAAIEDLNVALGFARKLEEPEHESKIHIELAGSYHHRATYDLVEANARAALSSAKQARDSVNEAIAYNLLAIVARQRADPMAAMEHYERALEIDQRIGNRRGMGARLGNIGNINLDLENYEEAIGCFRSALANPISKAVEAVFSSNLGLALLLAGDTSEAREVLEETIRLAQSMNAHWIVAEARARNGAARAMSGEVDSGLADLSAGLELAANSDAHEVYTEALWLRGRVLRAQGRLEEARAALTKCREAAAEHNLTRLQVRAEEEAALLDGLEGIAAD